MSKFYVFKERPDLGDRACERILETDDEQEAVNRMMAASTATAIAWIEPSHDLRDGKSLDRRFHIEVTQ